MWLAIKLIKYSSENKLTSLKGYPKYIGKKFYIDEKDFVIDKYFQKTIKAEIGPRNSIINKKFYKTQKNSNNFLNKTAFYKQRQKLNINNLLSKENQRT